MSGTLGELGTRFFALCQMRKISIIRTGDVVQALGISEVQERSLLSRLARNQWIVRVQRGVYRVPERLPVGGKWTPGQYDLLQSLMREHKTTWQICGPNAFNRYGFSEQIPNRLYVYNNRLSGDRSSGVTKITFIKIADDRLGDTESFPMPDGSTVFFSSRLRTLFDAVYDWSRFGSLPAAFDWITSELNTDKKAAEELIRVALKYGNIGTIRRMGKILEINGVETKCLLKLRKTLVSSSLIPLIPSLLKRGPIDRQWGIIDNRAEMEEQ